MIALSETSLTHSLGIALHNRIRTGRLTLLVERALVRGTPFFPLSIYSWKEDPVLRENHHTFHLINLFTSGKLSLRDPVTIPMVNCQLNVINHHHNNSSQESELQSLVYTFLNWKKLGNTSKRENRTTSLFL